MLSAISFSLDQSKILSSGNGLTQQKLKENIVGKGEIIQNEQFHLFPLCFLCNLCLEIL